MSGIPGACTGVTVVRHRDCRCRKDRPRRARRRRRRRRLGRPVAAGPARVRRALPRPGAARQGRHPRAGVAPGRRRAPRAQRRAVRRCVRARRAVAAAAGVGPRPRRRARRAPRDLAAHHGRRRAPPRPRRAAAARPQPARLRAGDVAPPAVRLRARRARAAPEPAAGTAAPAVRGRGLLQRPRRHRAGRGRLRALTVLLYLDQSYLSGIVKRKPAFRELEPVLRAAVSSGAVVVPESFAHRVESAPRPDLPLLSLLRDLSAGLRLPDESGPVEAECKRRLAATVAREFPERAARASDAIDLSALAIALPRCALITCDAFMADVVRRTRLDVRFGAELYTPRRPDVRRLTERLTALHSPGGPE